MRDDKFLHKELGSIIRKVGPDLSDIADLLPECPGMSPGFWQKYSGTPSWLS